MFTAIGSPLHHNVKSHYICAVIVLLRNDTIQNLFSGLYPSQCIHAVIWLTILYSYTMQCLRQCQLALSRTLHGADLSILISLYACYVLH